MVCGAGVGLIALLSLLLSPWALRKADEFRVNWESRGMSCLRHRVCSVSPSRPTGCILFDNVDAGSNRVGNIFVHPSNTANSARW